MYKDPQSFFWVISEHSHAQFGKQITCFRGPQMISSDGETLRLYANYFIVAPEIDVISGGQMWAPIPPVEEIPGSQQATPTGGDDNLRGILIELSTCLSGVL